MERYEKLFREAERISPPAGMWERIAARASMGAKRSAKSGAETGAETGAPGTREGHWGWKLAASLAVGMGLLAAMLVVLKPAPQVADKAGGAEDFTVARAEATPLPDEDDLYWHADLGEESGMEWEEDALLFDPAAVDEANDVNE